MRARAAASDAVRDEQPLTLQELAMELKLHVRTLQAAARTGRLEVHYATRSAFGRPHRLSTHAAGKAFLQSYYKRYGGQGPGTVGLPEPAPVDYERQLRELQRRFKLSQGDLAELVGAANRAVVYQWESGKRVPSPVVWSRLLRLCRPDQPSVTAPVAQLDRASAF